MQQPEVEMVECDVLILGGGILPPSLPRIRSYHHFLRSG